MMMQCRLFHNDKQLNMQEFECKMFYPDENLSQKFYPNAKAEMIQCCLFRNYGQLNLQEFERHVDFHDNICDRDTRNDSFEY